MFLHGERPDYLLPSGSGSKKRKKQKEQKCYVCFSMSEEYKTQKKC